ncbi:thiol-disulfide isomerase/thioredoxin [Pedobacter africanus]|uniref:Thiol-disulfide isomerase/thioredoxin n=1 Tax=Pedobacter africanus TaxID=151894 RepID=A0ACC6L1I5_9SPHI|nr:thioredoxin domain-containing protein [Pedobacter africanus]MDR6785503.1 thiol-disulfide isomerase/thioredoxin [Pedobacter africanus]
MIYIVKCLIGIVIGGTLCSANAKAQNVIGPRLGIGDKAPELRHGAWLKGRPVKTYEKDRLYVVEFWATWCGPCVGMIPHLSKIARQHASDVSVIGVNIWEDSHGADKPREKPYDVNLPRVKNFLKGMGSKVDYNIVMDNNEEYMGKRWMKAAGQVGIPCSFMVKNGTIMWIGHPAALDSMILVVKDEAYDIAAERSKSDAVIAARVASGVDAKVAKIRTDYAAAARDKQYDKAIAILDAGSDELPDWAPFFGYAKFQVLLDCDQAKAFEFMKKWQGTAPGFKSSAGAAICRKQSLSRDFYAYGINILKELVDNPQPGSLMYNHIAAAYANMGDVDSAIAAQEKAISMARQYIKENKHVGFVTRSTVEAYTKTLDAYKRESKQ